VNPKEDTADRVKVPKKTKRKLKICSCIMDAESRPHDGRHVIDVDRRNCNPIASSDCAQTQTRL
jgi:hypothetical protein